MITKHRRRRNDAPELGAPLIAFGDGCRYLGISAERARQMLSSDPLFPKPFQLGRRRVWLLEDLNVYLRKRADAANGAPFQPRRRVFAAVHQSGV